MRSGLKEKIQSVLQKENKALHIKDISDFFPGIPESTVRGRLNENVGSLFERVGNGFYIFRGEKGTVGLVEGNARDLKWIAKNDSVDMLIADHPREDTKSHKGGSRQFADDYGCFRYDVIKDENGKIIGSNDFKEKARVLKDGGFLIEILPEKNANNRLYLREIEDAAVAEGFDYFAEVPLTGGNSNIGRKEKNISNIMFFTKGTSRKLKIYSELLSKKSKEGEFEKFDYKSHATDFFKIYYETLSINKLDEIFNFHLTNKDLSIFKRVKNEDDLTNLKIAFEEFKTFLSDPKSFKSGTKKILPEFFEGKDVSNIRHQSQKPLNTLEDLILLTTNEGEIILEQFARSFVCGEAVIELGLKGNGWRSYLGIELDGEIVKEAKDYLSKKYEGVVLFTKEDFYNEIEESNKSNELNYTDKINKINEVNKINEIQKPNNKLKITIDKINNDLKGIINVEFLGENNLTNLNNEFGFEAKSFKNGKILSCSVKTNKKYNLEIIANCEENVFSLLKNGELYKISKKGASIEDLLIGIYNTFR